MSTISTPAIFLATTLMAISPVMAAEENPLSLSLKVGAEYDNNITVDSLDLTSRQGDEAALLDGSVGYQIVKNGDMSLKAGYSFSQSLHLDLSEFDLQIHTASLEAGTKMGDVDLGIAYRYNHISLGAESFLEMHSIRPSFSTLVGTKLLLTGAYEYMKQDFVQVDLSSRNADRHSVNAKTYFLLGKGRTISLGYKVSKHDTVAEELVYWGHTFDVATKLPINAIEGAKFRARYRYRQKDYSNIDLDIGDKRNDKRHAVRASVEAPFLNKFTGKIMYEYTDSSSNLASLNYDNHLVRFNVSWKL